MILPRSPALSPQLSEMRDGALLSFRLFISVLTLASFRHDGTFIPEPERLCDIWHLVRQNERERGGDLGIFCSLVKNVFSSSNVT